MPVGADPNSFIRSLHGSAPMPTVRSADSPKLQETKIMDVEEIVAAAEAAIAAAEEAIVAAEEAASGEGVAEIAERWKALRGKRATEEDTTAAAEEKKTDGERADGDEPSDEEKKEVEAVGVVCRTVAAEANQSTSRHGRAVMSQKTMTMFSGYVQKRIRSEIDGRPRTVTLVVMARWDVDNESGLVIGSEGTVDTSGCQIGAKVTYTPPA